MSDHERINALIMCGGTGGAALIGGLPPEEVDRTAAVNVSDDGGHSGWMLKEGLIDMAPGDGRQCTTAMCADEALRAEQNARTAEGHSPGNMRIAELAALHGSFKAGLKMYGRELNINGLVLPMTSEPHVLTMQDGDDYIEGEYQIGHRAFTARFPELGVRSRNGNPVCIDPEVEAAIMRAGIIIIAPGNPHGSIMPNFVIEGVRETLQAASAPKLMVANLLDMDSQSTGAHVMDQYDLYGRYIGEDTIDAVVYNTDLPDVDFLRVHASPGQSAVRIDESGFRGRNIERFGAPLLSRTASTRDENDTLLSRSMIRNDSAATGRLVISAAQALGVKPLTRTA